MPNNTLQCNPIVRWRHIAGLTQKQLASLLGYKSASSVSCWEQGQLVPEDKLIALIELSEGQITAKVLTDWRNTKELSNALA